MIGLIRDRDLDSGKPIIIVYKINHGDAVGFIIEMDEKCIVKPYREHGKNITYGEEFMINYSEIFPLVKDKERLYNYLLDKMIGSKLDY